MDVATGSLGQGLPISVGVALAGKNLDKLPFHVWTLCGDSELAERRRAWTPRRHDYQSGTLWKYAQTVGDAEKGAVTHPGARAETHIYADI